MLWTLVFIFHFSTIDPAQLSFAEMSWSDVTFATDTDCFEAGKEMFARMQELGKIPNVVIECRESKNPFSDK